MAGVPIDAAGHFVHGNTEAPAHPGLLSMFSLKGKTAIVTGAGAGIGLAVAHGLAEAGANVALWYNTNTNTPERAQEVAAKYGVHAKAYQVNITNAEAVKQAVDQTVKDFNGRLDVFIANAGIPWTQGPAVDGPLAHYSDVVDIDLNGTYYCAKYAAHYWRKQKEEGVDLNGKKLDNFTYGSFVATASMSGHIVNFPQLQAAYNAAKSGVIHLTKSLAVEWVKFARANTVSPGYIATEISNFVPKETKDIWRDKIPMGREGRAEELKGAYLYLASDASSYTTGADLIVDGGYCAP
ncbi:putative carbonyl reductase [Aspergillus lucknowensis]|uniref:Reductase with broad range of substrate specificity n=1 Tax=Aspergillus lucknowensis TaxID=176173 RepID=A0ABR4LSB2_9EURO